VAGDERVVEDLKIIATFKRLVTAKVDGLEAFGCDVLEAVGLVPSGREDVKGDLAALEE